ncbi:MAG: hypothetical protein J6X47_03630 [Clostridia bacterium]|nr:hypothetical protein [Clostridia bacterium]
MSKKKENRPRFRDRFRYWFDNRMANGNMGLIRILVIATILVIVVIAVLILVCGFSEDGDAGGVFWETMSTVINAWMPSYEDGSIGYIILMAVAAIAGLLVTSVLIGIFSTAIEEKITGLKNGNSAIIEENHIVVLGYSEGEFTLIRQLVDASADDRRCIVIAGDAERSEMEEAIRDNVEIPKNVRLVCRNIDIYDPASVKKCCVEHAQAVIINPRNDIDTVKALLAVSSVLGENDGGVYVCAVVSRASFLLPDGFKNRRGITQLLANRILSKVIAHSCTQPGLSQTLMEFLDYDGCNLCEIGLADAAGLTFKELTGRLSGGVPMGIFREKEGGRCVINPDRNLTVEAGDRLLVFTEFPDEVSLGAPVDVPLKVTAEAFRGGLGAGSVLILGVNEEIKTVLEELPYNTGKIRIAGADAEAREEITETCDRLREEGWRDYALEFVRETVPRHLESMAAIIGDSAHVVLLNDHEKDEDEADTENILRILNLRTIREENGLDFSITAELRRELSQRLVDSGDLTDFVVASNMVSLFLSQLADRPNLESVFRELISDDGNEIYLKKARELRLVNELTVREARIAALEQGYVLIGVMDEENGVMTPVFNPPVDRVLKLDDADRLIVIGNE